MSQTNGTEKSLMRQETFFLLAGGIAYDINNILASILGNIEILQIYAKKEDKLMTRLDKAEQAVEEVKCLTQQLLELSKEDALTRKQTANRKA